MKGLTLTLVISIVVSLLALPACGGRAKLNSHTGAQTRAIFDAQAQSVPSRRLADLSADDAKIITANHRATHARGKAGGGSFGGGMGFSGMGGGGLVTPSADTLLGEEDTYSNDRPIRLRAK